MIDRRAEAASPDAFGNIAQSYTASARGRASPSGAIGANQREPLGD
jgi:hypothetical protein